MSNETGYVRTLLPASRCLPATAQGPGNIVTVCSQLDGIFTQITDCMTVKGYVTQDVSIFPPLV